ncbi:oxidoreductase [Aspergillus coremiiformis]|uniref:Oxidoreductase n=1 Tax=Aspergillus coremiiformis TaxID=138285 RepID=A0A5N6ZAK5_9EURO|nr:oxidoreductase [Aspergillus coremiiformis]
MPTQTYFDKCQPFPEGVPTATLSRISYAKLLAHETDESTALFNACRDTGFFELDFQDDTAGQAFLQTAEAMFHVTEEVHAMDVAELMKYTYQPPGWLFGYKWIGDSKVEDGRLDRFAFYNVSRDDITGVMKPPLSNPSCIESRRSLFTSYMTQAHAITTLICSHLDVHLGLPRGTLSSLQPLDLPSGTSLRMLYYPPHPPEDRRNSLVGHTDIGTLTILFNVVGGLQILTPGGDPQDEASWRYTRPVPGCALVNLGDAMVEWTAGILRSNMHRVTFAPGDQGKMPRYSLAYLVRPYGDAPMKRLSEGDSIVPGLEDGEEANDMTAREWETYRTVAIRDGRDNARSRGGRRLDSSAKKKESR